MTAPQVNIDQLRRQFPEEVVRYFDAVVAAKFATIDSQIEDIQEQLNWIQEIIDEAVAQAEQDFIHTALQDLVEELKPYIRVVIEEWVYDTRSWEKFRFYIDSQENIDELTDKDPHLLYIWTETWEDDE